MTPPRLSDVGSPADQVQLAGQVPAHQDVGATLPRRDQAMRRMAHRNVVEALASDQSKDPFVLHERDG